MRYFFVTVLSMGLLLFATGPLRSEDIKLSYNSEWAPYSAGFGTSVGGVLPELLREIIEKRMGISVNQNGAPWKRAQLSVQRGSMDGFVTVPTAKRLKHTHRSKNIVYTLEMRPALKRNGKAFKRLSEAPTLETLRTLRVCDILGNQWAQRFYGENGIIFSKVSNVRTCLLMVNKGRLDVIIHPAATLLTEIGQAGLDKELTLLPKTFGKMEFALMISKKSKFGQAFLEKFDTTLDAMKRDGSYQQLIDKLRGAGSGG